MYTTPHSSLISQTAVCHELQVDHHLYADDTQLFIAFSPHASNAALGSLHVTLAAISQWMASNFLTLNPSKTEFLLIGLPTQLSKLHMPNLSCLRKPSWGKLAPPPIVSEKVNRQPTCQSFSMSSENQQQLITNDHQQEYFHVG
jgi:hypothetical protein